MKPVLVLNALLALCAVSYGQTNPLNVPQPPSSELQKFEPFLGKYEVSGDFANLPWTGTLELRKAIRGWYIQQIILIKSPGIDREFLVLATWDKNSQKYRLWGFQTLPTVPEGEIRFEKDEMITEWATVRPDGTKVLASNRYHLLSKDELEIVSYTQIDNRPIEKIGFLKGRRILNAEALSGAYHPAENSPQPPPEMQSLAKAFEGTWSISEKYEPDEWTPNGGVGYGEEVWRSGPGGFTFMEEVHDHGPTGESFGLALAWWDKDKGFQGIWCENHSPKGCDLNAGSNLKWDSKQQIIDNEFQRNGRTFRWHEVLTDITPTSFVQTADIGEKGRPLRRWLTIHATRVTEASRQGAAISSDEAELRVVMEERRKASLEGDTEKIASSMADEYLQTDIYGYRQDKTAWLKEYFNPLAELIKAGKFRWDLYEQKDVQFRVYGDCALVIGKLEAKGTGARPGLQHTWVADPNASFSGTLRFTHTYVKQNGKWLLAALHNAVPLTPSQPAK